MGKPEDPKNVSRREVLRLAGTAAAFCTSFGYLLGSPAQKATAVEDKHLQMNWAQAEIKWYSGTTLLHSSAIPAKVVKHLESDVNATVEVKLFQSGKLLRSLGTIQGKH